MNNQKDKRMVGDSGYEIKQAFRIHGKEILLGENMNAENGMFYLVVDYAERMGIVGEYSNGICGDDYLEILAEFTERINKEAEAVKAELDAMNLPSELFTAEHCHPNNYSESIAGKVVAIKAEVFSPEYRRGDNQIVLVSHGFGTIANPHGNAVYCRHLNNGEQVRFERYEILGEVKPECLPDWAKEKLAELTKSEKEREDAR
jgi:hypothetical protein